MAYEVSVSGTDPRRLREDVDRILASGKISGYTGRTRYPRIIGSQPGEEMRMGFMSKESATAFETAIKERDRGYVVENIGDMELNGGLMNLKLAREMADRRKA